MNINFNFATLHACKTETTKYAGVNNAIVDYNK